MPANPVLKEQKFQDEISAARQQWGAPAAGAFAGARGEAPSVASPGGYATMSRAGTANALGVLLVILCVSAAFGYSQVTQPTIVTDAFGRERVSGFQFPAWLVIAGLIGFGLAILTSFKPKFARITAPLYSLFYGAAVGGISALYNAQYDGIVLQAVAATLAVAAAMWFLYTSRIIKVTDRFRTVVMAATLGIFLLYFGSFLFSIFGVNVSFWREPSLLGIGISLVIIVVAAMNLAIDFDFVDRASAAGSPKYMNWYGAFGITVTLVWLYLEILRLLSLLNRR